MTNIVTVPAENHIPTAWGSDRQCNRTGNRTQVSCAWWWLCRNNWYSADCRFRTHVCSHLAPGIVNRHGSTYSVQPGTYRLVLRYRIILTCTAPFEYVLFPPSTYSYVLFSPSTYSVRTSSWTNSMYRVRTEYRKHDKSTYFRRKVQTFVVHTSTYQYVLSTYFFAFSGT